MLFNIPAINEVLQSLKKGVDDLAYAISLHSLFILLQKCSGKYADVSGNAVGKQ